MANGTPAGGEVKQSAYLAPHPSPAKLVYLFLRGKTKMEKGESGLGVRCGRAFPTARVLDSGLGLVGRFRFIFG